MRPSEITNEVVELPESSKSMAQHTPEPAQTSSQTHPGFDQPIHTFNDRQTERRQLPSQVQILIITPTTLPSYRRLIALLLPIRYPERFYKESIADTSEASLARVAVWEDPSPLRVLSSSDISSSKVVGGIQCRLEDLPSTPPGERQLYVQTIAILSPFRQLGVATCLLDNIVATIIKYHDRVSTIYAHVWEANHEALKWYERRGFVVEGNLIKDYYRRLKPSGARIVRKPISIEDHLAFKGR